MSHKITITVEQYDTASALYDLILETMLDQEIGGSLELGNRHSSVEIYPDWDEDEKKLYPVEKWD